MEENRGRGGSEPMSGICPASTVTPQAGEMHPKALIRESTRTGLVQSVLVLVIDKAPCVGDAHHGAQARTVVQDPGDLDYL